MKIKSNQRIGDKEMKQFEVGKTYKMRSACDHECVWEYKVLARTEKSVMLSDGKHLKKCIINKKISEYLGAEAVRPLGSYSMAPILTAE